MSIETDAALIKHLIESPTGIDHTPTPWQKTPPSGYGVADIAAVGDGALIASFWREADRDLALYFVNMHGPIIGLLHQLADSFEFLALGSEEQTTRILASERAESTRAYAAGFATLGKAFHPDHPPDAYPVGTRSPDTSPVVIAAYKIMDLAPPGALDRSMRHYMAGAISAAIFRAHEQGKRGEPL